jgi:hydroxymethylpyrimidine/phosphomethylpyrimidine kinase
LCQISAGHVKAIKIGLIGYVETARAISTILSEHPTLPVILDPVLAAGGGATLSNDALLESIREHLLRWYLDQLKQ